MGLPYVQRYRPRVSDIRMRLLHQTIRVAVSDCPFGRADIRKVGPRSTTVRLDVMSLLRNRGVSFVALPQPYPLVPLSVLL